MPVINLVINLVINTEKTHVTSDIALLKNLWFTLSVAVNVA